MIISSVKDAASSDCFKTQYDLIVLACGSEPRCINLLEQMREREIDLSSIIVLTINLTV